MWMCRGKTTYPMAGWMIDGGIDGWWWKRCENDGTWGRDRCENEEVLKRYSCGYLFSSRCTDAENKQEAEANLRSGSITLLHDKPEISAAGGGGTKNPFVKTECVTGLRGVSGFSLGSDFRKKEMMFFKVCAKILVILLLDHEPFHTFSVRLSSDLKFCNIASSLTLRTLLHLQLVFHLF